MPIERFVDHERRVLELVLVGAISKHEIIAERRALAASAPDALRYDALIDLRRGSLALTTAELRTVAVQPHEEHWPTSRCAFVSPHDHTIADLRLFALWASRGPREYRIFRSLDEACEWLGLGSAGLCAGDVASD
jgi:hypothetical protein